MNGGIRKSSVDNKTIGWRFNEERDIWIVSKNLSENNLQKEQVYFTMEKTVGYRFKQAVKDSLTDNTNWHDVSPDVISWEGCSIISVNFLTKKNA